eukprot:9601902-Alexandrium_andersonii.AAC.1
MNTPSRMAAAANRPHGVQEAATSRTTRRRRSAASQTSHRGPHCNIMIGALARQHGHRPRRSRGLSAG